MPTPSLPQLPITDCPDGAGSINNSGNSSFPPTTNGSTPGTYVPPDLCVGDFRISQGECADTENSFQEQLAAENLNISGAQINVFKLLGVHEQGRLVDLTGQGEPLASSGNPASAFDSLASSWVSSEVGTDVVMRPAWLGYDLGVRKTSYLQNENEPGVNAVQHITSFRISQPGPSRVRQVRVERSNGGYHVDVANVQFTGSGNGSIGDFKCGYAAKPGLFMLAALTPTTFSVAFTSATGTAVVGVATVGVRFNSDIGSFLITAGSTPFAAGDFFSVPIVLDWYRVDVVNLPDMPVALVNIKQSSASRYWRLVPLMFTSTTDPWIVDKLELFDYNATRLDNIQDSLLMENRDRDYANASLQLKAAYTPLDTVSDLSRFGFQIADVYTFTVSFADMVRILGRPIVVGDVIELPAELQYDHNLRPVRKFVEVTDTGWPAEGFTTGWKPVTYRFQAQHLIPGQEHRDIFGTVDTQKYVIDDGSFFDGIEQIQTAPLTTTETNQAESLQKVPEKGENIRELASGTNRNQAPGTYDGVGPYVEDGLPPDGLPYTSGFKLPDVSTATDNQYFRLEYDPKTKIAARLYKFSAVKNKWIYVETDRRGERTAHKPSQREVLERTDVRSLSSKKLT